MSARVTIATVNAMSEHTVEATATGAAGHGLALVTEDRKGSGLEDTVGDHVDRAVHRGVGARQDDLTDGGNRLELVRIEHAEQVAASGEITFSPCSSPSTSMPSLRYFSWSSPMTSAVSATSTRWPTARRR